MPCPTMDKLAREMTPFQESASAHEPPSPSYPNTKRIYLLVGNALSVVLVVLDAGAAGSTGEVAVGVGGLGTAALVPGSDGGLSGGGSRLGGRGLGGGLSRFSLLGLGDRAARSGLGGTDLSGLGSRRLLHGSLGLLGLRSRVLDLSLLRVGSRVLDLGLGVRGLLDLGGLLLSGGGLSLLGLDGSLGGGGLAATGAAGGRGVALVSREARVVVADAAADVGESLGALDLLKGEVGVVGVLEPVETPVATVLEKLGELVAVASGRDTTVLSTAEAAAAELGRATVEDTDTTTGHLEIEVVLTEVASGVGGLDNHGLALHGTSSEGETVKYGQYQK